MNRTRWRLMVACLAVIGAAIAVAGGSAGNRDGVVTFVAMPGPGSVTYGENIAYRSTFDNTAGSMFTQIRFVQTRPTATLGGTTYTADVAKTSCAVGAWFIDEKGDTDRTNDEFVCDVQAQLAPDAAPAEVVVAWKVPADITSAQGCDACLKTKGWWLIKERKSTNGNEVFPKESEGGPIQVSAELLAGQGSTQTLRAGGYELGACTGSAKSLSTNQALSLANPVATSFCLPPFAASGVNVGLATSITEIFGNAQTSEVCIADYGLTCPGGTAKPFGPSTITFEFRVFADALPNGYKITQVFHNSTAQPLPMCPAPTSVNGCVVSITPPKGNPKIWTIVTQSETNGPWSW